MILLYKVKLIYNKKKVGGSIGYDELITEVT